ncbi:hypothetical protein ACIQGZ_06030 [Streptomyces sp. NPDC092296]|uniref:hypothetical protein n=1 Tax=Streptomyces sp. NPDC092296 TaxID=3366012 RepID=UPI00380CF885
MRTTRLLAGALACATAVACLAGCSDDKKSTTATPSAGSSASGSNAEETEAAESALEALPPAEITAKAKAALLQAASLTMELDVSSGSQGVKGKLSMDKSGHCSGTMSTGGGSAEILKSGDTSWVKPDAGYLKMMDSKAAAKVKLGQYIKGGGDDDLVSFCDMTGFAEEIPDGSVGNEVTKVGTETVNGARAVVLSTTADDGQTSIYVATEGIPYPLKMIHKGDTTATVTLSDFGKSVTVKAPPADQVIDSSQLKD